MSSPSLQGCGMRYMFFKAPSKLRLLLLFRDPWERWIGGGGSGGEQAGGGLHCGWFWGQSGPGGQCHLWLASPGWASSCLCTDPGRLFCWAPFPAALGTILKTSCINTSCCTGSGPRTQREVQPGGLPAGPSISALTGGSATPPRPGHLCRGCE